MSFDKVFSYFSSADEAVDLYIGSEPDSFMEALDDLVLTHSDPLEAISELEDSELGVTWTENDITYAIQVQQLCTRLDDSRVFVLIGWGFLDHQNKFTFSRNDHECSLSLSQINEAIFNCAILATRIRRSGMMPIFSVGSNDGQDQRRLTLYSRAGRRLGYQMVPLTETSEGIRRSAPGDLVTDYYTFIGV